ncbi:MAG: serine hydrolase [Anaerolineae bacterium]|nr:serine hydrolase [Anaerolineae bacterium]
MAADLSAAEALLRDALGRVFPAAQLVVRWRGRPVLACAYGWLDPEARQRPTRLDTLFDLASVTKLFVVSAFMRLVERGTVGIHDPVRSVLPELDGPRPVRPYEDPLRPGAFVEVAPAPQAEVDAGQVTFRHLLTHTSGLPAWRPLYRAGSPAAALQMALDTPFACPIGTRVVYSDVGLILLGLAVERLSGEPLAGVVQERVTRPLGLAHTRYLPIGAVPADETNVAPTELCAWRGRRLCGEVHDENAAALGGVAGHAGLFSTAEDVAALGQAFLDGGGPLFSAATVGAMTRLQAEDGTVRRGLGFALWSPDPEASGNPFSPRAFGHTGFTGTSLWVDPVRQLVVACLTNRVYYGRQAQGILAFRVALHREIVRAVDESASGD